MNALVERYGPFALIAGASEGIGAAFAHELAREGFGLVLIARRAEPLERLAAELRAQHHVTVHPVALDLATPELEARFRELAASYDVGLVVYNAALSILAPFLETPLDEHRRVLDVNARGPLTAAHVFGARMAERGRGGLVLLSSLTAFWGSAWLASYGATKAFELALGEALAHELRADGVDVIVSCAGATRTPGFSELVRGRRAPRSMSPEEVATETLQALPRGGALIPGALNRLAYRVLSQLPRRAAIRMMAKQTRSLFRRATAG